MGTPDVMAQYKLFTKYYNSAYENDNLKDYQTANQLREKIVPQVEAMLDDDNKMELAGLFEMFSDFVFEYYDSSARSCSLITETWAENQPGV